jgi:MoaA/NifB/PqqE/SkfB family radical SAM enzyme
LNIIADKINPKRIVFVSGFHPDFADFKAYADKMTFLKNNGFLCQVNYVTYPKQIGKMEFYKNLFEKMGVNFIPSPFRGVYNGKLYPGAFNKKEKEYMVKCIVESAREIGEDKTDFIEKRVNFVKSKNKLCFAGYKYAVVRNDGTIYPCMHNNKKKIGNIFDDDFEMYPKSRRCQCEECPCNFGLFVKKK